MPEIVDLLAPAPLGPTLTPGLEIPTARRAFSAAQPRLAGAPISPEQTLSIGWHDTSVNLETGSFAVVQLNAGLDDLIGEIVRVRFAGRSVFAYVLDSADVPVQLSLTRRLFAALNRLTLEELRGKVAPVA